MPYCSTEIYPEFQSKYNLELQSYAEQFMTKERPVILKKILEQRTRHVTLVAESLLDEHNIHALMRSSECFGLQDFHNIPYKDAILKKNKSVTRGAFQWMHIYNYDLHENPTTDCIAFLKNKGFKVYVTSSNINASASYTPYNVPIEKPLAIMMGNEHRGISEEALALADGVIEIPMYGFTESFNVSVAGSLILSPIVDRLRKSTIPWQLSQEEQKQLYYEWIWNSFKRPDVLYKEWLVNNPH